MELVLMPEEVVNCICKLLFENLELEDLAYLM